MAKSIHSQKQLDQELNRAGDKLVIIDFFAIWCLPCKMFSPKFEALATKEASRFKALRIDVDECEDIASDFEISVMPTCIALINGRVIGQAIGTNIENVKELISRMST